MARFPHCLEGGVEKGIAVGGVCGQDVEGGVSCADDCYGTFVEGVVLYECQPAFFSQRFELCEDPGPGFGAGGFDIYK